MKKADLVSAGVVAVFGLLLLFAVIPNWVPRHEEGGYGLGARVMPVITATLVTGLGVLFFITRLLGREKPVEESAAPIGRSSWKFLLLASLFLIAMTALFEWVGFRAAGPLTIAGFMIAMGERRPVPIVLTSVAAAGVIWLFFWQLLNFPLP